MNNNRDATEYLLAFGANLPGPDGSPPEQAIEAAIWAVSERLGHPLTSSRLFRTPCFPAGSGPDYVNAAVRGTTQLIPEQILTILHEIENKFGRERTRRCMAARPAALASTAPASAIWPAAATPSSAGGKRLRSVVSGATMLSSRPAGRPA